ncbi:MAG: 1-deoxy-D-xylulose-5-phosphate synthase [Prevotellaceae bacterium]|nr:1-deoxy-D-xylulose-5-phosphate synthase [Prevotella sp.]MDD7257006.1 1-deoxy-D-xylulose-5-phosphate synthase [Prevotellaceae bacterium]MDY6130267.1 1-deoxy-D-xylulose-5-phosphate synthase [Prevotella sp.]
MYLEKINGPKDIKKLEISELNILADETRHYLLKKVSEHGGHIGPNLGMVEATVALHYVFNSPEDKIVFDVSHQSYPHKILTGRKEAFMNAEHYDDVSGYSEPSESDHDHFVIGHTSTSVSLACGLVKGRDLTGGKENVIAVIGDGSLSGGEALEGLNVAGSELQSNFIIVVNDNQMSIAENHGGLYKNLQLLRETNGKAELNFFRAMGLDYLYVDKGNDVAALIEAFQKVKDADHPTVVHINTLKGKGLKFAEENKEQWHWGFPFDLETGKRPANENGGEDYASLTAEYLLEKMEVQPEIVAMTAGTPTVMGFVKSRRDRAGKQFVDVGIAEETAAAMASGIAKRGGKPVWGVYSTFVQRAYDQLSQDLCINDNPALLLVFWGGIESMNDVTHTCFYDIPLLANIPNLIYMAPSCREEYFAMMDWALCYREHPVAIRVPINGVISRKDAKTEGVDWAAPKYEITRKGSKVAVLGLGTYYQLSSEVCDALKAEGIEATLVNPRIITALDKEVLEDLKKDHSLVVTLEDGQAEGGWGEKIAAYYGDSSMKVLVRGERKQFEDRYDVGELLKANRLTVSQIVEDVVRICED